MKRSLVILGVLAVGAFLAPAAPASAQVFSGSTAALQGAKPVANIAYLTALSVKPQTGALVQAVADLEVVEPGSTAKTAVVGVVTQIIGTTGFDVLISTTNGNSLNSVEKISSTNTFTATCVEYTYNAATKVWSHQTVSLVLSPKTTMNNQSTTVPGTSLSVDLVRFTKG
jgi:hypothetical protein